MQKYDVVEVFESVQGEGGNMGLGMLFVRFAGCNLNCRFCDTREAQVVHPVHAMSFELLRNMITSSRQKWVCLTGGEPCLQVDADLIEAIHGCGKRIALESNGTIFKPEFSHFDYVTISPKVMAMDMLWFAERGVNEMRFLVTSEGSFVGMSPEQLSYKPDRIYISPEFTSPRCVDEKALKAAMRLVTANPGWRLSVQVHKWLNIR